MIPMAESALDGFQVDGAYTVVDVWEDRCGITNVSRTTDTDPTFRNAAELRRTPLHAWMEEVRETDPFQQVSTAGAGGRLYILTAPKSLVFVELHGSPTRGYTPSFSEGTSPREVETCCDGCGADLAETMTHEVSDSGARQFIACGACGRKYRIRSEFVATTPNAVA